MDASATHAAKLTTTEETLYSLLVESGINETRPKRVNGEIVYEGLEDLTVEVGGDEVIRQLKSLHEKGILKEDSIDYTLFCPHCGSIHVQSKYNCPRCQSLYVNRVQLFEHPFCGYIGNRAEFDKGGKLICPKCNTLIGNLLDAQSDGQEDKRKKIRVIGSSFECEKCGSKFEKPLITHKCEKCGASFTYRESIYERLPTYRLVKTVDGGPRSKQLIGLIVEVERLLSDKGFTVENNAKLNGRSGVEQAFDIVARRGVEVYMLDVSASGDQNDIIGLLGKKMDVPPGSVILIDMSDNSTLSSLGKAYGIEVLNAKDGKHLERLSEILDKSKADTKKRGGFRFRK